jgi:hypothetical protein
MRRSRKALCQRHRGGVERRVASANQAQGPAHTLLDEVAVVGGGALDERQAAEEGLVIRALVVEGQAREQGEGGALAELIIAAGALRNFGEGVRGAVEQVKADRIAEAPVVEVAAPAVLMSVRRSAVIA